MSYNLNVPKNAREVEVGGKVYKTQDGRAEVPPTIGRMLRHIADVTTTATSLSHTDIPSVRCRDCGRNTLFGPECKWCGSEDTYPE